MGDEEDGLTSPVQVLEEGQRHLAVAAVECSGRLIGEQHGRVD